MRARIVAAVVIGLVVLSLSTAAWGKGGGFAGGSISGPNLPSGGITIGGSGPAAEDLSRLGLFEGTKDRPPSAVGITRAELGPRYTLVYRMTDLPYGPLRQVLYPYAKSGVWTYTPPGQQLAPGEYISGGWWVASSSMLDVLAKYGLPGRPPAVANPANPANPAGPGGATLATQPLHSTAAWPWVAGVVLTVVLATWLLAGRRFRRATQLG